MLHPHPGMEDLAEDWEYEEPYDSSLEESGKSNLSWLLSKGLWLGKKVVITGVLFSAAPFVLPPLVVVSAIGLVASVPAGVVLVSYTCTEKIMSKWLPMPPLSSTRLDVEDDSGEYFDVTEKEQGGVSVWSGVDSIEDTEEVEQNAVIPTVSFGGTYYEEDFGEYDEAKNKGSPEMSYAKIENEGEENENKLPNKETDLPLEVKEVLVVVQEDTKNVDDPKKQSGTVVVSNASQGDSTKAGEVTGNKDAKTSEEGTASLLHKRHDDVSSHEPPKKKKKKKNKPWLKLSHGGRDEHKTVESKKETDKPVEIGHGKPKLAEDNAVEVDHKAEKGEVAAAEIENLPPTAAISSLMALSKDKENGNITEASTDPIASQEQSINVKQEGDSLFSQNEAVTSGLREEAVPKQRVKDIQLDSGMGRENNILDKKQAELRAAVLEDPVTKAYPTEKKLWEQIDALRLIVGYKAVRKPLLTDELRALYVFTGVEPPSPFEKSTDIRGTEDELHFLMSIVGVK